MTDKRHRRRRASPTRTPTRPSRGRAGLTRSLLGLGLVLVTMVLVGSIWGHSMLTSSGMLTDGGSPSISPRLYSPTPRAGGPGGHGVVTRATPQVQDGAGPAPERVAERITAIGPPPGSLGAMVVDVTSGRTVYSSNASTMLIPASNLKVLTGLALLNSTDAGTRYATRVVGSSSTPGRITLVGGGDPYLQSVPSKANPTFASTQDLAARTAKALRKSGVTSVQLGYDDTLFAGPTWSPHWPARYADQVTHISALWVDEGLPGGQTVRSTDPSGQAAQVFARQLTEAGVKVTGTPTREKAPEGARTLAGVDSAPVEDLLAEALLHSDNSTTEVLSRQMALASGRPATFDGAAQALTDHLRKLGVWQEGAVIQDGSGLSRGNRISATMLERTWRVTDRTPRLQPMTHALPVSGVSGSLLHRFDAEGTGVGRGVVHAKTGTLNGVASLSGWVRTADGRILVEAFILNNANDVFASRAWLDKASSALASCGCG